MNNILLLQLAGIAYLGLIAAGMLMPKAVGLKENLRNLPPFIRRLFWVYYVFIATCLVCFGAVTFFMATELAAGTPLARAVCAFLALFWSIRLVAALFVFDVRPYLKHTLWKVGYHATNLVFATLPFVYAWVGWTGGRP
jgi:hypothetical protein